jgi:hypothetical protein
MLWFYALQLMTLASTCVIIPAARSGFFKNQLQVITIFSILEQHHGKQAVMKLLSAEDPNVRYHALLAVQKLMVSYICIPLFFV